MPQCPQCSKPLVSLARQCPSCRADLDLLVDYVNGLQTNLVRADQLTRAGELGLAVWAYLEVLEIDPDNPAARHQVGQVATAVRQFDRTAPGRRWLSGAAAAGEGGAPTWIKGLVLALALAFVFSIGFFLGRGMPTEGTSPPADPKKDQHEKRLPDRNQQLGR
jgi:hypothetical protein